MSEKLIEEIERRLNAKTIHDIRQIARACGVPRPADGRKERIIEGVLQIATGESDPAAPSVRGAHPKSAEYDRQLVADIMRCREINLSKDEIPMLPPVEILVASSEKDSLEFVAEGLLYKEDGKYFMRVTACRERNAESVYVSDYFVNAFKLRCGDYLSGKCKRDSIEEIAGLTNLTSVNGTTPSTLAVRADFDSLTPVYPQKRLTVSRGSEDVAGRLIDLLCPIGAGQRALICAPHGADKTSLLKSVAEGLKQNNPDIKLIAVLIEAGVEECADFRRSFRADVFASALGASSSSHIGTAEIALEYAKRQTENKKDVVLIIDDISRLTRAYNNCSRQLSPVLDAVALDSAKKFLAAARCAEEGGSLTVITTVNNGGDAFGDAVYAGLNGLCNLRLTLSEHYVRSRIYPPVDIKNTFSSGDEKLLTPEELKAGVKLRGEELENIIRLIARTNSNEELCEQLLR